MGQHHKFWTINTVKWHSEGWFIWHKRTQFMWLICEDHEHWMLPVGLYSRGNNKWRFQHTEQNIITIQSTYLTMCINATQTQYIQYSVQTLKKRYSNPTFRHCLTFSIEPFTSQVSAVARELVSLGAHCKTTFSLLNKNKSHLMGNRCPIHLS